MNNYILSNKRVITIATMLSFMMLAASSMPSLVPTGAFAQQEIASDVIGKVNGMLTQQSAPNSNSGEEQDASDGDNTESAAAAATADEEQDASDGSESSSDESGSATPENAPDSDESESATPDSDINLDSASEEDSSSVEEDDFVTIDPILQTNVQPDVNAGVDVALVMDEEDCDEANTEVVQANGQDSDQQAGSEGRVGDNSFYVSPKYQISEQIGVNAHVDLDVVLVEGCNPVDDITQVNAQESGQGISSELESSPSGTAIIPADQRADKFAYNIGVNDDYIIPVL